MQFFKPKVLTQLNNFAKYYNFLKLVSIKKAGVQQIDIKTDCLNIYLKHHLLQ